MASSLQKVLQEMQSSSAVPAESVAQAEQYMTSLLTGIQKIAVSAQQAALMQQDILQPFSEQTDDRINEYTETEPALVSTTASRRLRQKTDPLSARYDPYNNPEVFRQVREPNLGK